MDKKKESSNIDLTNFDQKINLLKFSMEDNQNTIKFTDQKAGVVLVFIGVIITFLYKFISFDYPSLLNFHQIYKVFSEQDNMNIETKTSLIFIFLSIILLIISIWLCFLTISPGEGNINRSILTNLGQDNKKPLSIFYMNNFNPGFHFINIFNHKKGYFTLQDDTSSILNNVVNLTKDQLLVTLITELQKITVIRELKIQRVKHAINYLKISIILIVISSFLLQF